MSPSPGENIRYKFNNNRFGLGQLNFDWHNWQLLFTSMWHSWLFTVWDSCFVSANKTLWNRTGQIDQICPWLSKDGVLNVFVAISNNGDLLKKKHEYTCYNFAPQCIVNAVFIFHSFVVIFYNNSRGKKVWSLYVCM